MIFLGLIDWDRIKGPDHAMHPYNGYTEGAIYPYYDTDLVEDDFRFDSN